MQGMSERQYAAHVGLSRGAIQKAKSAGRLVLHADGSIDAAASDRLRAEATDPSKTRKAAAPKEQTLKPVPEAAVSAVGDTLKEQGMAAPVAGGGTTFLQAKTAHEVLKAQERRIRLAKLKGELVDRDRATSLVFRLARDERDACATIRPLRDASRVPLSSRSPGISGPVPWNVSASLNKQAFAGSRLPCGQKTLDPETASGKFVKSADG